MQSIVQS